MSGQNNPMTPARFQEIEQAMDNLDASDWHVVSGEWSRKNEDGTKEDCVSIHPLQGKCRGDLLLESDARDLMKVVFGVDDLLEELKRLRPELAAPGKGI